MIPDAIEHHPMAPARNIPMMVRSIQTSISSGTDMGMSVAKIQGIDAEKNNMVEIDSVPTTNFVIKGVSITRREGMYISAIPVANALPARDASGSPIRYVNG